MLLSGMLKKKVLAGLFFSVDDWHYRKFILLALV
jgi:hypothetical protein